MLYQLDGDILWWMDEKFHIVLVAYLLLNIQTTMENNHDSWVNPLHISLDMFNSKLFVITQGQSPNWMCFTSTPATSPETTWNQKTTNMLWTTNGNTIYHDLPIRFLVLFLLSSPSDSRRVWNVWSEIEQSYNMI